MSTSDRATGDHIRRALKLRLGAGAAQLVRRAAREPFYKFERLEVTDHTRLATAGFTPHEFWRAVHGHLPDWWRP